MSDSGSALLLLTTCPDEESADRLALLLVENRLAACVSRVSGVRSVYRWQDRLEQANEVLLLVKTTSTRYETLAAAIRASHPNELPEIIAVGVDIGLPEYLQWITENTAPLEPG